jgi:uncharacterized protein
MSLAARAFPEIPELNAGGPTVRIPDRLSVPFTPRVRAIVETAAFQRLSHISQLGLTWRVYPGARHSRFEHSLGVFYNACRYVGQLSHDPQFMALMSERHVRLLLVSALLHDVGHWPFCHLMEDLDLAGLPSHEDWAQRSLQPGSELAAVIESEWDVDPQSIWQLLSPQGGIADPAQRLLQSVLSGPIDIDKLDYLERDSLHCGVTYGRNFDRSRLIQSLIVNTSGDGLALSSKGKTAAELMVVARYVMFSEVYWHHAVRSASCMLGRVLTELFPLQPIDAWLSLGEPEFIEQLKRLGAGTSVSGLVDGLFGPRRRFHKRILEFSGFQEPELYRQVTQGGAASMRRLSELLTSAFSRRLGTLLDPHDVLIDVPPLAKEVEFKVDICDSKAGRSLPLTTASPLVAALAHQQFDEYVKRVRVFARREVAKRITADVCRDLLAQLVSAPAA